MKKFPTPPKWLRVFVPAALIVVWLTLAGVGGPYFGRIEEVSKNDLVAFLPKSSESVKVTERVKEFSDDNIIPAIIVFAAQRGELDQQRLNRIDGEAGRLEKIDGVVDSISPAVVSDDKKAAFVVVPLDAEKEFADTLEVIREDLARADLAGTNYKITGAAGFSSDLKKAFAGIDGLLLITALTVVFVILLVVYRSALLPVIVLMTSVFALSAAILLVWNLAKADVLQINGQVQGILFILVIGAATDYSLLYVSRYREELYRHAKTWQATYAALKGSVEPILASGGTVIVGLMCLLLSDLASNAALGPVGAIGVAMAILASLTFLPAVLYVFGRASFWPLRPRYSKQALAEHKRKLRNGVWQKIGMGIERYPRYVWALSGLVLLLAALAVPTLRADGVPQSEFVRGVSEARDGQALLKKHFPGGSGTPAQIITRPEFVDAMVAQLDKLKGVDGVSVVATDVDAGFKPLGKSEASIKAKIRTEVEAEVASKKAELEAQLADIESTAGPFAAQAVREQAEANIPDVEELVESIYPFADARMRVENGDVQLRVTLADEPDSDSAKQAVRDIRKTAHAIHAQSLVGGTTAAQVDTNDASLRDRMVIIPVVLLAITAILMLLLRSIAAPVLLLGTTVLSFGAALGVAALLFNHVWQLPGADPSVILYAFVFLVALGIDYNIFLMTRVREESLEHGTGKGIIKGLVVTGEVITSAGVVLAATFAALGVIPILFLFQLAFIVSFGVLLDTFVVRSLLVPALIKDIGSFVWWPSKLRHKR